MVVPMELPTFDETVSFMRGRIDEIQRAVERFERDGELPKCTDEELWKEPDVWAVYKAGGKRALKLYDNIDDALYNKPDGGRVEHRPGLARRCNYCECRTVCEQHFELKADGEVAE
jgi:hypothetical protein